MKRISLIFQFLILANISIIAQTAVSVDLQNNSCISISGTSNVLSFKFTQSGEKLLKKNFIIVATQNQHKITLSQNIQAIPVNNFTSNNKLALRDFLKLVKSNIYPSFQVQLNYVETTPKEASLDNLKANASVNITITGVTKHYMIPISSEKKGDLYAFNGIKKLNIHDFGLSPPTEMMGLIRVNEWIDIDFNIICKISPFKSSELNALNTLNTLK